MNELRSFLRAETHDLHETLDGLIGPFSHPEDYARFLTGSLHHRAAAEAAIGDEAAKLGLPHRPLASLIRQDLQDLGLPVPSDEPRHPSEELHLSKDMASLLGATYVLEGSALGARVLVKSATSLGMSASHGARYLSAQAGSITGWRDLLARLDTLDSAHWRLAADAARQVFRHALQAFTPRELPAA